MQSYYTEYTEYNENNNENNNDNYNEHMRRLVREKVFSGLELKPPRKVYMQPDCIPTNCGQPVYVPSACVQPECVQRECVQRKCDSDVTSILNSIESSLAPSYVTDVTDKSTICDSNMLNVSNVSNVSNKTRPSTIHLPSYLQQNDIECYPSKNINKNANNTLLFKKSVNALSNAIGHEHDKLRKLEKALLQSPGNLQLIQRIDMQKQIIIDTQKQVIGELTHNCRPIHSIRPRKPIKLASQKNNAGTTKEARSKLIHAKMSEVKSNLTGGEKQKDGMLIGVPHHVVRCQSPKNIVYNHDTCCVEEQNVLPDELLSSWEVQKNGLLPQEVVKAVAFGKKLNQPLPCEVVAMPATKPCITTVTPVDSCNPCNPCNPCDPCDVTLDMYNACDPCDPCDYTTYIPSYLSTSACNKPIHLINLPIINKPQMAVTSNSQQQSLKGGVGDAKPEQGDNAKPEQGDDTKPENILQTQQTSGKEEAEKVVDEQAKSIAKKEDISLNDYKATNEYKLLVQVIRSLINKHKKTKEQAKSYIKRILIMMINDPSNNKKNIEKLEHHLTGGMKIFNTLLSSGYLYYYGLSQPHIVEDVEPVIETYTANAADVNQAAGEVSTNELPKNWMHDIDILSTEIVEDALNTTFDVVINKDTFIVPQTFDAVVSQNYNDVTNIDNNQTFISEDNVVVATNIDEKALPHTDTQQDTQTDTQQDTQTDTPQTLLTVAKNNDNINKKLQENLIKNINTFQLNTLKPVKSLDPINKVITSNVSRALATTQIIHATKIANVKKIQQMYRMFRKQAATPSTQATVTVQPTPQPTPQPTSQPTSQLINVQRVRRINDNIEILYQQRTQCSTGIIEAEKAKLIQRAIHDIQQLLKYNKNQFELLPSTQSNSKIAEDLVHGLQPKVNEISRQIKNITMYKGALVNLFKEMRLALQEFKTKYVKV